MVVEIEVKVQVVKMFVGRFQNSIGQAEQMLAITECPWKRGEPLSKDSPVTPHLRQSAPQKRGTGKHQAWYRSDIRIYYQPAAMDAREIELRHSIERALQELSAATSKNCTERKRRLLDAPRAFRFYISPDEAGPQDQRGS
jgi:hypothetical protein